MEKKYRKNVAMVVFNDKKELLICERSGYFDNAWQFPQGGVDSGENIEAAAYRELFEETSIISVKLVKMLDKPIRYDFPKDVREKLWNIKGRGKFFGQEQYWILLYFYGKDSEININTKEQEFKSYAWKDKDFAINNIVDFKKESYIKALDLFEPYIKNYEG